MTFSNQLIIAVDFDGTIVEDAYPKVGKPMIFAFETLKKLQEDGHRLILWTYRCGSRLDDAVKFCEENGIVFYAVNNSFPEEEYDNSVSRKINADLFIDDRNVGGFIGWGEVYQKLTNTAAPIPEKKKGFFGLFK
ncbi:hydrolase [Tamlana sp. 2_MG-2023]|uniref:BT0820 family HAD-type phosphatase n=1 Tax=unclassified Tamlana TaxID=2614803 RepID=UPI0026E46FE8|nr:MULTISPECIES: hydrolase [unclassified Tamlana]MDO6760321.1 hydrolase [Tamlana sp. 2_MG-2023]MDO6789981.1 hydrolase [Tamlana sp. 1_MG-2023]